MSIQVSKIQLRQMRKQALSQSLCAYILKILGWKTIANLPATSSYLAVGSPHTSNWDFIYMLLVTRGIGLNPHFIAKDSLFLFPLGWVIRRLGGIPVNRRVRSNFVQQIVAAFQQ